MFSDTIVNQVPLSQKLGFYLPFNSQGPIGTSPQNCHLWELDPHRVRDLSLSPKINGTVLCL